MDWFSVIFVQIDYGIFFDEKIEIIKAEVMHGDKFFFLRFRPQPHFQKKIAFGMLALYDTVMLSLDNEFCLMFSDEQFNGNKYD